MQAQEYALSTPQATRAGVRRWPLALIALPAAVAVWSGWVGLGALCGFGLVHPLPGIVPGFTLNTAITLPVGVESYGAYALGAWLTQGTPIGARRFARGSAIGALLLGMLGQVAFHLLTAAHATRAPWPVVVLVACLPVVTLGFGAALTHLLRGEHAEPVGVLIEPAGIEDMSAVSRPAITTAWPRPERLPALTAAPVTDRPATRTAKRSGKASKPAARAAAIVRKSPDISGAELGRKLGVSDRTGRRLLAQVAPS